MPTAYCFACGWQRDADEDERTELGRAMIDHHVETGHGPIEQLRDGENAADLPGTIEMVEFDETDAGSERSETPSELSDPPTENAEGETENAEGATKNAK